MAGGAGKEAFDYGVAFLAVWGQVKIAFVERTGEFLEQ